MSHSFRQQQTGSIVRCQRPTLLAVLAWMAVLALVLGNLGSWNGGSPAEPQVQARPLPAGDGGGEELQERDPAKVRRQSLVQATRPVAQTRAGALDAVFWHGLSIQLHPTPASAAAWADVDDTLPWRAAPGHRQQRGQAPPLA